MKKKKIKRDNHNEDLELVRRIQRDGCEQSLKKIIEKHAPLYFKISKSYLSPLNSKNISYEDIAGDANLVIYKSLMLFDFGRKIKPSTWIGIYARYHFLNLLNHSPKGEFRSIEEHFDLKDENVTNDDFKNYVLDILSRLKDDRIKKIFELRYFGPKPFNWKQIGAELKLTSQHVQTLHNKSIILLKEKLKEGNCNDLV